MMLHMEVGSRIQRLSTSVVNKIAAGEVIERPASVVKELLENCVDALATRIEVEIEQGGSQLIRVVDDGEGIHPDDLELAVTTHATSKIRDADDLFQVQTLGFRGEALASIAEISRFRIRSRRLDQLSGVEMDVDGGIVKEPRPCGAAVGTTVEVRELFWNTPVRRKFLKNPGTEFGHIAEQFTRIALAHPNLNFVLRHNGRTVFDLPATHELQDRLRLFFGRELGERLIPVEGEHAGIRLWGYVAHPSQTKSTRKGQYLFLNGRWFQDRSLQHAVAEAYRGLVMVGRHPLVFLFLEMPPAQVDVNVHPTKAEVRFQDVQLLFRLILSSIRNRFLAMDLDDRLTLRGEERRPSLEPAAEPTSPGGGFSPGSMYGPHQERESIDSEVRNASSSGEIAAWATTALQSAVQQTEMLPDPSISSFSNLSGREWRPASTDCNAVAAEGADSVSNREADPSIGPAALPEAIGKQSVPTAPTWRAMQIHDCYVVVETDQGLTVIDQHALHERILYERLRHRVLSGNVEIQRLLLPITLEFTTRDTALLLDQQELLADLGLLVEPFGGNTLLLTGYPPLLAKADPAQLLRDLAELMEESGPRIERRDLLDKLLHMMSCKAAIKAGQRLTPEEIDALLAQRHLCDDHHHCPHGRPTALTLSRAELDRQFGRLG